MDNNEEEGIDVRERFKPTKRVTGQVRRGVKPRSVDGGYHKYTWNVDAKLWNLLIKRADDSGVEITTILHEAGYKYFDLNPEAETRRLPKRLQRVFAFYEILEVSLPTKREVNEVYLLHNEQLAAVFNGWARTKNIIVEAVSLLKGGIDIEYDEDIQVVEIGASGKQRLEKVGFIFFFPDGMRKEKFQKIMVNMNKEWYEKGTIFGRRIV